MTNNTNKIVTKHNDLVRYKRLRKTPLTLTEKKLINFSIANLDKKCLEKNEFPVQEFKIADFCKAIGVEKRGYEKALREITFNMLCKPFEILKPNFNGDMIIEQVNWFVKCQYNVTKKTITLQFHESLKPYVLQLKGQYTTYRLEEILKAKNVYMTDWYELFKSYISMKNNFEMTIDEIRIFLNIETKYSRDIEVVRACVRKPIDEINKKTDLMVEMEEVKEGNKITSVIFHFQYKNWEELLDTRQLSLFV